MGTLYTEFLRTELNLPEKAKPQTVQASLTRESLDGPISEGFDIYSLVNQLGEVIDADKAKLERFGVSDSYGFYSRNSGKIEVSIEGDIQLVFFIIKPICWNLTQKSQEAFEATVCRASQQDKILGLLGAVPGFIEEMEQLEDMKTQRFKIAPEAISKIRDLSTGFAAGIAGLILWFYKYDLVPSEDGSYDYKAYMEPEYYQWIVILGYCQLVSSSLLLLGFWLNQRGLVVQAGWRMRNKENSVKMQVEVRQLEKLKHEKHGKLRVEDLDMSDARIILAVEGPYSELFYDKETKNFNFYHFIVKFEYYWTSLSFLIQSGGFIFAIQYLCFSLQGML
jgi:hypothetical protein